MTLDRRSFLRLVSTGLVCGTRRGFGGASPLPSQRAGHVVRTVTGPIGRDQLGLALTHEHVLVDFVGAAQITPDRYDPDAVFTAVLPHLHAAAEAGVGTIFECTPMFLGRDPELLRRLSRASRVHLVTNTGLYGAREGKFLPAYAGSESSAQLARRWIAESRDGIAGTGIRPGFIKCGVNPTATLRAMDRKLVEAAALTHAETGLTLAVHTGRGPALEQLDVLREFGVPPRAFVWVHAAGATDDDLFAAAEAGAWLSFDGLRPHTVARHVRLCSLFRKRGHLEQVLVSHDAGWYDPENPAGRPFRPYTEIFQSFLPALRHEGFTGEDIDQLLVKNPFEAFALSPKLNQ